MTQECLAFGGFTLDPANRLLRRDGERVDVSARYLDALILMVREAGNLITKDRFHDEVWRGIPVTDEALTQCIRSLRRALGDDAANPAFIETVPRHGYRFVAPVTLDARLEPAPPALRLPPTAHPSAIALANRTDLLLPALAGTLGGGVAGLIGGLVYGFAAAAAPGAASMGAISVLLVLVCVTILVALVGAGGVVLGITGARLLAPERPGWIVLGGALGGLLVGALAKLLGLDAFTLLFGDSPAGMTGALEGAALGASVGLACYLSRRLFARRPAAQLALAAGVGAVGGLAICATGGRLMAGSLTLLAQFPQSRLQFLPGEAGPLAMLASGAMEGALFAVGITGAMSLALRQVARDAPTGRELPCT